jgi:hypothetical protein
MRKRMMSNGDWLKDHYEADGYESVLNNNDLFLEWILENFSLKDAIRGIPGLATLLFEEYNNDWIEAVDYYKQEEDEADEED